MSWFPDKAWHELVFINKFWNFGAIYLLSDLVFQVRFNSKADEIFISSAGTWSGNIDFFLSLPTQAMKQAHAEVQEENREFDEDAMEEDEGIG